MNHSWRPSLAGAALLTTALVLAAALPARAGERGGGAPSPAVAPAGADETARLLACLQRRYGAFRDLAADFVQESRVASLGRPRTRSGRLSFLPPGRMRWEYDGPDPQLIVADGKQIWFHRPERKQAIVQPMDEGQARQTPLLFLLGKGDFAREFTWGAAAPAPATGGALSLELRPRVETAEMVRLVLEVVPGQCRLAATVVEDAFGNLTRLAFANERADAGVDPGRFRFSPPAGTEIVKP